MKSSHSARRGSRWVRRAVVKTRHIATTAVNSVPCVAIGRASQPFPRSKRSVHVSAHSAFRLGPCTTESADAKLLSERCTSLMTVICLPLCLRSLSFPLASPDGPSPCPRHYGVAFGYYAVSALQPIRLAFSRPPQEVKR